MDKILYSKKNKKNNVTHTKTLHCSIANAAVKPALAGQEDSVTSVAYCAWGWGFAARGGGGGGANWWRVRGS